MTEDKNIQVGAILLSVITFFTCLLNIRKWIRFKKYVYLKLFRGSPSFFDIAERYIKLSNSEKKVAEKVLRKRFNLKPEEISGLLISNYKTHKDVIAKYNDLRYEYQTLKARCSRVVFSLDYYKRYCKDLDSVIENQHIMIDKTLKSVKSMKEKYFSDIEKLKNSKHKYECLTQELNLRLLSAKSK